jgi:hypothetical protein
MIGEAITRPTVAGETQRRAVALCWLMVSALLLLFGVSTNYWVGATDAGGAGLHGVTIPVGIAGHEVAYADVGHAFASAAARWRILDTGGDVAVAATYVLIAALALLWMAAIVGPARALARVTRWLAIAALGGAAVTTAGLSWYFRAPVAGGALAYLAGAVLAVMAASRLSRRPAGDLPLAYAGDCGAARSWLREHRVRGRLAYIRQRLRWRHANRDGRTGPGSLRL